MKKEALIIARTIKVTIAAGTNDDNTITVVVKT